MLFLIFFLLVYCIFGTFSSVLSEEELFCWDHNLAVVRRITRNKHLDNVKIEYPPAVWLWRWQRRRFTFVSVSGETAGRNVYGLSILIIICTIVLLSVCDSNIDLSSTPFIDLMLLRNRLDHNSIIELFVLIISGIIFYVTHSYNKEIGIASFEYYIIMLFSVCSFCFFLHATNLILLYVLIELQSISSYILTAMSKRNRYSVEAGLKYFILGSFTSILLAFGFSLLYGFSGMLHIDDISIFILYVQNEHVYIGFMFALFYISLLLILVGFLFKIYASPFHFWVADIYQGSPTSVTIFLSTIPVLSYVYVFIKLYVQILSNFFSYDLNILFWLSIFSILSGVAGGLAQKKIKKLIAYSSITTIGYILAALSCHSIILVQYSLFYLFIYVLNIIPVFILLVNYRINNVKTLDSMYCFTTLYHQNRWLFAIFFSFFFSLSGIPPFSGFFSKLYIFSAFGNGSYYVLLIISIFSALLSCYYYLRVIKMAYYDYLNSSFFVSTIKYGHAFICVLFFIFNIFFLCFSDIIEDVCLYITLCLV
jgi:NADH-quinone oxidoreductase subunit N